MVRGRINLELVENERARNTTFLKRKNGLFKKVLELSILCNCEIGIVIFNHNGKLVEYSSKGQEQLVDLVRRWGEYTGPVETKSNKTALQTTTGRYEQETPRWAVQEDPERSVSDPNGETGMRMGTGSLGNRSSIPSPNESAGYTGLSGQLGLMNDESFYQNLGADAVAAYDSIQKMYTEAEHMRQIQKLYENQRERSIRRSSKQSLSSSAPGADEASNNRRTAQQQQQQLTASQGPVTRSAGRVSSAGKRAGEATRNDPPRPMPSSSGLSGPPQGKRSRPNGLRVDIPGVPSFSPSGTDMAPWNHCATPTANSPGWQRMNLPETQNSRPSNQPGAPTGSAFTGPPSFSGLDWQLMSSLLQTTTPSTLVPPSPGEDLRNNPEQGAVRASVSPRGAMPRMTSVYPTPDVSTRLNSPREPVNEHGVSVDVTSQHTAPRVQSGMLSPTSFIYEQMGLVTPRDPMGAGGFGGGWLPYVGTGLTPRWSTTIERQPQPTTSTVETTSNRTGTVILSSTGRTESSSDDPSR